MPEQQYKEGGKHSFRKLVDVDALRVLFERFSTLTGLPVLLTTYPGQEELLAVGMREICSEFHLENSASEACCRQCVGDLRAQLEGPGDFAMELCGLGLAHGAAAIVVEGVHVANLSSGQVLLEKPDIERFRTQAEDYGYDVETYLEKLDQVPIIAEGELKLALAFLASLAAMLAEQALNEARSRDEHERSRATRETLAHIIDATNVGTWAWNVKTGEKTLNERWADIIGYTPQELSPVSNVWWAEHCHPDDVQRAASLLDRCLNGESDYYECEVRLRHKDGDWRWVLDRGKVTSRSADGDPLWMHGTHQDITERKLAEQALRASEQDLRTLVEGVNAVPWRFALKEDRFTFMGEQAERILGYPAESWTTMAVWEERIHSEGRQAAVDYCVASTSRGEDHDFEYRCVKPDGTEVWIRDIVTVHTDDSGTPSELVGVMIDVTEQRRMAEALRSSEQHYRTTLESIGDAVVAADRDGNVVGMNGVAERLTGWGHAGAKGKPLSEVLKIVDPETGEVIEDPVQVVLKTGETVGRTREIVLVARDGTKRRIAELAAPIRDENGAISGVVLTFRDVTEEVQKEQELRKMQKLESLGTVAGGIAHDFNNLLTGVIGCVEMAQIELAEGHPAALLLKEAQVALQNTRQLTGRLLTFAEGGDPILQVVDTDELIRTTVAFNLAGTDVLPRFDLPEDLWPVKADKGQIGQVLANLTLNAKEAMPGGGHLIIEGVNIADGAQGEVLPLGGACVGITIRDEGTGIPSTITERIFDPYFSTKEEGHGLGLAVVHSIVKKHGGHISVESTPGVGTTFRLFLPAARPVVPRGGREPQKPEPAQPTESLKILVMDDEPMLRNVASQMLQKFGHSVDTAIDGEEAIEKYTLAMSGERPYDLVIMDLTIPGGMGGKDAVGHLVKIDPDVRVIVSSGYSTDPALANFRDYGFAGQLAKPFGVADLKREVGRVMESNGRE